MAGDVIRIADLIIPAARTPIGRSFFNPRFTKIGTAINLVAARQDAVDIEANNLVTLGLQRINNVLGPLLTQLQDAAQTGFLVANAVGLSVSLTAGIDVNFTLTSSGLSLFAPTPYLLALDNNDSTNWGILSLNNFNSATGLLACGCVYASKTQASTSWSISDNSAVMQAMVDLVAQAQAAATSATSAVATLSDTIDTLNALAAAIAAGPVASVAGRSGAVTLSISDIGGLSDALLGKASTASVAAGLAGKQDASAILSSLAGLTLAADKLIFASGASSFATASISAYMRSLLGAANLGALLTAFGISPFVQTTLDDADGGTFLSTLGVSTFIKTLLDDPDGAAARATIAAAPALLIVNPQTGTAYTLSAMVDNNAIVTLTNASAIALTLPNNAAPGFSCLCKQGGAGQVTIAAQAGAAVVSRANRLKSVGQYSMWTAVVEANAGGSAARWIVGGDLTT